ncbi:MAG: hypothetical protein R3F34_10800 [Planctomycetota bacterium]
MDSLLARLTNFGYEFFGIVLPGAALVLSLVLVHLFGSQLFEVAHLSIWFLPTRWSDLVRWEVEVLESAPIIVIGTLGLTAYCAGHFLKWLTGGAEVAREGRESAVDRLRNRFTKFAIGEGKPASYSAQFAPLLPRVAEFLRVDRVEGTDGDREFWKAVVPVGRALLERTGQPILVTTFQNKYTLHRSLTAVCVLQAWLSMALALFLPGLAIVRAEADELGSAICGGVVLLASLAIVSHILASSFRSSYRYYWSRFGDYLVAELHVSAILASEVQEPAILASEVQAPAIVASEVQESALTSSEE